MSKLQFKVENLKELRVASEGLSNVIEKSYSAIVDKTKKIGKYLAELLPIVKGVNEDTSKQLNLESVSNLNKDQFKFIEVANKYPFQEMREIKAWKPEGSNCTYIEFLNELEIQINRSVNLKKNVIEPYMILLAKLVSKDNSIKSSNLNKTYLEGLEKSREAHYSDISKLYKKDSTESVTIVGKVINRNNDWEAVLSKLNSSINSINLINIKEIQKDVDICNRYLSELIEDIKRDEDINISPETVKQLADYTYQVAKEVEYLALTHFRVLTIKGSIENTIDAIIKVKGD